MIQLYHHPPCRLFHNVSLKARPPLPEKSSLTNKTWVKQRESQPQIHTLRPRARSVLIGRRMRGHFNQNLPPCGRGGRERQEFACARMLEGELPGMKAKHIPAPSVTVLRIPHDRMSRLREMDTDLVLASAFERHLDERGGRTPSTGLHPRLRDDSPLRASELAVSGILHAPHEVFPVFAQVTLEDTARRV